LIKHCYFRDDVASSDHRFPNRSDGRQRSRALSRKRYRLSNDAQSSVRNTRAVTFEEFMRKGLSTKISLLFTNRHVG
jgi:hypothetical protein